MTWTVVVPVDGRPEVYSHEVDVSAVLKNRYAASEAIRSVQFVSLSMATDGVEVGTVTFALDRDRFDKNSRATALTGAMCGAFTEVHGLAVFTGLSPTVGLSVVGALRLMEA